MDCGPYLPALVPHGYMAVDLYCVLSGFIMAYTYLHSFQTLGWRRRAYLPFLAKRMARIVPLGIAVTLVVVALAAAAAPFGRADLFLAPSVREQGVPLAILINLAHLQGFLPDLSLNDPSWSISVEFFAYLLFPLLVALVFEGPRWQAPFVALACAAAMLAIASLGPLGGFVLRWPAVSVTRCLVEFTLGLLAFRIFASSSNLRRLGEDRWTWLVTVVAGFGFLLRIDLLAAATFPVVVLAYALNRGTPARLLGGRIPTFLGVISFSIYLVHNVFRKPESALLSWAVAPPHSAPLALSFALIGSLSILPFAAAAYYGVERPGRTAVNRLLQRADRSASASAGGR